MSIRYEEVNNWDDGVYSGDEFSSKKEMGDKYNKYFPRRTSSGNDCVQVGDKYFRIYYDCTNYEPHMWYPKYSHLRNIVEREREEITKAEYIEADIGQDSPWNMCEGTGY